MEDEYRGEQLVYGDLPRLFDLRVSGNITEIGYLDEDLRNLDCSLFVGFVSFMMEQAGYYNNTIYDKNRIEESWDMQEGLPHSEEKHPPEEDSSLPNLLPVKEAIEEWATRIECSLAWAEELNRLWEEYGESIYFARIDLLRDLVTWSHYYENADNKELTKVIFTNRLTDTALFAKNKKGEWRVAAHVDPACKNYIVVQPATYKMIKQSCGEKLENLREALSKENVSLVSVDEFVAELIPHDAKRKVSEIWISVKNRIFEELKKNNPILVYAQEWERFVDIDARLKKSKREFEDNKLEDSVKDAALACEEILAIPIRTKSIFERLQKECHTVRCST
jgi:hypothetical protein